MLSVLYVFIGIYFLIGALAILLINRKAGQTASDRSNRWIKYSVYFAIVNTIVVSILYSFFVWIAILIAIIAFAEFMSLIKKSNSLRSAIFGISFVAILSIFILAITEIDLVNMAYIYLLVFCFDGFAQIIGQLIGRRKITPVWSPNKTLEGFLGAFMITIATSVNFLSTTNPANYQLWKALLFGAAIALFSFIGDILASYVKRQFNQKDYSNIIPQHGGILDRFDSLIFAVAGYYGLIQIFTTWN